MYCRLVCAHSIGEKIDLQPAGNISFQISSCCCKLLWQVYITFASQVCGWLAKAVDWHFALLELTAHKQNSWRCRQVGFEVGLCSQGIFRAEHIYLYTYINTHVPDGQSATGRSHTALILSIIYVNLLLSPSLLSSSSPWIIKLSVVSQLIRGDILNSCASLHIQ